VEAHLNVLLIAVERKALGAELVALAEDVVQLACVFVWSFDAADGKRFNVVGCFHSELRLEAQAI
jgi:hypothetical protein